MHIYWFSSCLPDWIKMRFAVCFQQKSWMTSGVPWSTKLDPNWIFIQQQLLTIFLVYLSVTFLIDCRQAVDLSFIKAVNVYANMLIEIASIANIPNINSIAGGISVCNLMQTKQETVCVPIVQNNTAGITRFDKNSFISTPNSCKFL